MGLPRQTGNMYTASLWSGLASLISDQGSELEACQVSSNLGGLVLSQNRRMAAETVLGKAVSRRAFSRCLSEVRRSAGL